MGITVKSTIPNKKQKVNRRKCAGTELHAKVWFELVSSIENKRAYGLDMLFLNGNDIDGTERKRAFENAQKGMLPSRGTHARRSFDIVSIVDNHPKYKGTKFVFESPFWMMIYNDNLLELKNMHDQKKHLEKCLERVLNDYKSKKNEVPIERSFEFKSQVNFSNKPLRTIKIPIPKCLLGKATFDTLALIGGLYREAYLSCSDNYSKAIKEFYIEKLFELFKCDWMSINSKKEIFRLSQEKILTPIRQSTRNKIPPLEITEEYSLMDKELSNFLAGHDVNTRRKVKTKPKPPGPKFEEVYGPMI